MGGPTPMRRLVPRGPDSAALRKEHRFESDGPGLGISATSVAPGSSLDLSISTVSMGLAVEPGGDLFYVGTESPLLSSLRN